jgi:hypothetical protein
MTGLRKLATLAAAGATLALAAPAYATDFPVTRTDDPAPGNCDPGDCSLREAFVASEAAGGPDAIIVPAGTYRLEQSTLPTVTQDLTVTGADADATVITGSTATGGNATTRAGAILHTGGLLTLSKLSIHGNSVTVTNPATQSVNTGAGGILSQSAAGLVLVDATVSGNVSRSYVQSGAGGVQATKLTLTNSKVVGNSSNSGVVSYGGVAAGTIDMAGSTVRGNSAGGSATEAIGGIGVGSGTISASTISDNTVAAATITIGVAGLSLNNAKATNVTVSGNSAAALSATSLVGGVEAASGGAISDSTIARNAGRNYGSISSASGFTLTNSIVATASAQNCSNPVTSGGGNVEDGNSCGLNPALGDQPDTNALLGPLQNNGGSTETHALRAGSPAIDAVPLGNACAPTDQRGAGRPNGPRCDSGAYEFAPPPPANLAAPSISGESTVGETLTCQPGTWDGNPAFTFAWLRNGAPVAGAESASYVVTAADRQAAVQCQVAGSNAGGSTLATSAPAVGTGLVNRARPSVRGGVRVGKRAVCTPGTWTGTPTFSYRWLRNGKRVRGATKKRYTPTRRDRGRALQCVVTARKAGTATVAESKPKIVAKAKRKR